MCVCACELVSRGIERERGRVRDEKGKEGEEMIKTKWDRGRRYAVEKKATGKFKINKMKHIWLQESKQ